MLLIYAVTGGLGMVKAGVYGTTVVLYYLFAFLISFELTPYFGKEIAFRRSSIEDMKRLMGELVVTSGLGLILSLCIAFFLPLIYKEIDPFLLVVSTLSGIFFGIEKNLSGFLLGEERMHIEFTAQLATFLLAGVPTVIFIKKLDIGGLYIIRGVVSVLAVVYRMWAIGIARYFDRKVLGLGSIKSFNWKDIGFFSATGFAFFIQYHFDLFLISMMVDHVKQGAYLLGLRLFQSFCLLAEMMSFSFIPYISRVFRDVESGNKLGFRRFYRWVIGAGMVLGVCVTVLLFFSRGMLVRFFNDEDPVLASTYLKYFAFFLFFRFASFFTGSILSSTRYQDIRFYFLMVSTVIFIVLGIFLGLFYSVGGVIAARGVMEVFIFVTYLAAIAKVKHKYDCPL